MQKFKDLITKSILFDSHCHLNGKEYDKDRDDVIKRAEEAGVKAIIDVGVSIDSSKQAIVDARKYDIVYAAVGIDMETLIPGSELFDSETFELDYESFQNWLEVKSQKLDQMLQEDKVLMVGETGIDDYWLKKAINGRHVTCNTQLGSIKRQEELFRMHIGLAKKYGKPLTVHSRNAINRCLQILKEEEYTNAVFHSLTPDLNDDEKSFYEKVSKILSQGFYIGINGIVTFKNADIIKRVYQKIYREKLEDRKVKKLESFYQPGFILETDSPYLAPNPYRGERNEPSYLPDILKIFSF